MDTRGGNTHLVRNQEEVVRFTWLDVEWLSIPFFWVCVEVLGEVPFRPADTGGTRKSTKCQGD